MAYLYMLSFYLKKGIVIKKDNKMIRKKGYSDLAIAGESATITCVLEVTQRKAEEWEREDIIVGCWHGKHKES